MLNILKWKKHGTKRITLENNVMFKKYRVLSFYGQTLPEFVILHGSRNSVIYSSTSHVLYNCHRFKHTTNQYQSKHRCNCRLGEYNSGNCSEDKSITSCIHCKVCPEYIRIAAKKRNLLLTLVSSSLSYSVVAANKFFSLSFVQSENKSKF